MSPPGALGRRSVLGSLLCLAFLVWAAASLAEGWPRPGSAINDQAQVIEAQWPAKIEDLCGQLARRTGIRVAVATLPSLEGGETMEQAGARLLAAWAGLQPGQGRDGLILVAVAQRRVRIEVGEGMRGVLGETQVARVRDQVLIPHLREGRYGQGLHESLEALAGLATGQAGAEMEGPVALPGLKRERSHGSVYLWGAALLLILLYVLAKLRRAARGRRAGGQGGWLAGLLAGLGLAALLGRRQDGDGGDFLSGGGDGDASGGGDSGGGDSGDF